VESTTLYFTIFGIITYTVKKMIWKRREGVGIILTSLSPGIPTPYVMVFFNVH
jgi:hypothetical protein